MQDYSSDEIGMTLHCPFCESPIDAGSCSCGAFDASRVDDDDGYAFSPDDLVCDDEQRRRWAIIAVSKQGLHDHAAALLDRLAVEPSNANRRHIVRALGSLGCVEACPVILALAEAAAATDSMDLIVGDVARVFGDLRYELARPLLTKLLDAPQEWTRQNARRALRLLE